MFFRTFLLWLRRRRGPNLGIHDIGRLDLQVRATDLDVLGHMNNGVYLSIMDLGRQDLMQRSGAWATLSSRGYYPVAASVTVSYRRSLGPRQRFTLETRIVGYDAKSVFVEQRFVVGGEVCARGFVKARFLKRSGGPVSISELADATGADTTAVTLPDWLGRWSTDVALPPSRASAPSVWS